jgi:hypothetical protein
LPDYAPIPKSALGPALNDQGYYVGRVERNLYYVTDGVYQAAFLTTPDGVVLFDAPPSIGGNLRRAVDEIAAANGVTNQVTHFVYSHHHADHGSAAFLFDGDVTRIGHEETKRLLVVSVRLSTPSLALFLIAGALIGAGSGAVFKGTTGIVLAASPPQSRVAMTSDLLIALYVGLSVPVIGAGSRSTWA